MFMEKELCMVGVYVFSYFMFSMILPKDIYPWGGDSLEKQVGGLNRLFGVKNRVPFRVIFKIIRQAPLPAFQESPPGVI